MLGFKKCMGKLAKLSLSLVICAAVLMSGVATLSASAETDNAGLSQTQFLYAGDLQDLCRNVNNGFGLLFYGNENTDLPIRILFGTRDESTTYYTDTGGYNINTVESGAITWLVAGLDKNGTVVLYSEDPVISTNEYGNFDDYDSRFGTTTTTMDFYSDFGNYMNPPTSVYPNHWGASDIRVTGQFFYNDAFTSSEKELMDTTYTPNKDYQTGTAVNYSTEDILYIPAIHGGYSDKITVGANDVTLGIDSSYVNGVHWLREPISNDPLTTMIAVPDGEASSATVNTSTPSISYAFRLDLTDVAFASVVDESMGSLCPISENNAFKLRLKPNEYDSLYNAKLVHAGYGIVRYSSAPEGSKLVAQFTANDGNTYPFYCDISGNGAVNITEAFNKTMGDLRLNFTGKAWIEQSLDDGSSLSYATEPIDISNSEAEPDYADWGTPRVRDDGVVEYIDEKSGVISVEICEENVSDEGIIWLSTSYDNGNYAIGIDTFNNSFNMDGGLRFYANWVDRNHIDYGPYYSRISDQYKRNMNEESTRIFVAGVRSTDGRDILPLEQTNLYAQIGYIWDSYRISALKLNSNYCEEIESYSEMRSTPYGVDNVISMRMGEENVYAIYERVEMEDLKPDFEYNEGVVDDSGSSDGRSVFFVILGIVASIIGIIIILVVVVPILLIVLAVVLLLIASPILIVVGGIAVVVVVIVIIVKATKKKKAKNNEDKK